MYIQSAAMISPQVSFKEMISSPKIYEGEYMTCVEPDYTRYIDAKLIRRMSRIIKMGVAAASEALTAANVKIPDAIITGTAYGCLADTEQFLTRMVEFKEELLSPTAFIQSTHNTIAAQIALMLQCKHYNNTFVHRGTSFEAALVDAQSLMDEGDANTVLVGAVDEIIEKSHQIMRRFGQYKNSSSDALLDSNTKGTMAGDGAQFFVIQKNKTEQSIAKMNAFNTYHKSEKNTLQKFMNENNIDTSQIDLIISGANGDVQQAEYYHSILNAVFDKDKIISYKQYCGEYPTAASFALWMASEILKNGYQGKKINQILKHNNYKLNYNDFYRLKKC